MSIDDPYRNRRQKVEVPVHSTSMSKSKYKNRIIREEMVKKPSDNMEQQENSQNDFEKHSRHRNRLKHEDKYVQAAQSEEPLSHRLSRRHLSKENEKLHNEREQIILKFNELEELSVKKITKLKEKIEMLQNNNEEIVKENNYIMQQFQDAQGIIEDLKYQLEVAKKCKTCKDLKDCIDKLNGDNNSLRKIKHEYEEDMNMLKTVVFRLNFQLERYQEKLRNHKITVQNQNVFQDHNNVEHVVNIEDFNNYSFLSEAHQDHSHTPISWGSVNIHTLGPLLDAYQDTISEKEEIIQNYEKEMSKFTGKLKNIIRENEELHRALIDDNECSAKLKIEIENLQKELRATKEQNDVLIKKCAMKQDKLDEVLKCYETKIELLRRDHNVMHGEYMKSKAEITALKEKNRALEDSQSDFRSERQNYIPISVHTASVNECKKWYEELKSQYEQEKTKQVRLIDELNQNISQLKKEKEDMDYKIKQLEKHIKKEEERYLDLEHTLNQVQVSRSACRKQLHKAMTFAKDLVKEQETLLQVLNQRQQENKAVKKIGSEIALRMDTLKTQLKDVQKDAWQELSTVEKRLEQQQDAIEEMKKEHQKEIDKLNKIIVDLQQTTVTLKEQSLPSPSPHYLLIRDKYK